MQETPQVLTGLFPDQTRDLPPAFVCSRTNRGLDVALVHVAGELDMATTPRLERTLRQRQSQARLVVLDLRDLQFMDSSGVHTVVNASVRAREAGRRLIILRGPPNVDRLFELTGTAGEVEIHDLPTDEPPVQVLLQLAGREQIAS